LEYLTFDNGRRVAAFGRAAGLAGMAIGLLSWAKQQLSLKKGDGSLLPNPIPYFESTEAMIAEIKKNLQAVTSLGVSLPKVIIIGALGRCGGGSTYIAESCGIVPTKWDLDETKQGGPFQEILQNNIFVNCILLLDPIPPFITMEMVHRPE
jgi:saccharopine dehydrogenase (NAD+, L-lysine forming)